MSNLTVQTILNQGYYPVGQLQLNVIDTPTQISPVPANVNLMMIKCPLDISGGARLFIGDSAVTVNDGLPLFDINAGGLLSNTAPPFQILTSKPDEWYMVSNIAPGVKMNILFLAAIGS